MRPAGDLWDSLRRVRSLDFVARSASSTGWNGSGSGTVVVASPTQSVLTFTESGSWQPALGTPLRFSNVFRWSLTGPADVRLEHLRFGADHPVYLFDLVPQSGTEWVSVSPHRCRADCYTAELRLRAWGVLLHWAVAGPRKDERIEYEYRW
jgi:hypothetical protein